MISILLGLVVALLVAAGTTPLVRRFALDVGAVDSPTARRVHSRRVPRLGGIALVLGFFFPMLLLRGLHTHIASMLFAQPALVGGLVAGAIIVSTLGAVDDIVGVKARYKLIVQIGAAGVAFGAGFRIEMVALPVVGTVHLGWFAPVLTAFWIVGVINALNLIDGLDGLAGGVAFFACVTNFVIAYLGSNWLICLVSACLAGAIIGFLLYNFNPATIFMGDSGSMFLGFVLATMSIFGAGSQKGTTAVAILVPILALGLPIVDTLFAMGRRFLERRPLFSPDRGHIHHRLLDLGITHRRAVLVLYGASVLFTLGALAVHLGRSWQIGVALVALVITLTGTVRVVGALNSSLVRHSQKERARGAEVERLRKVLPSALVWFEKARSPDELPAVLARVAESGGLLAVELRPVPQGSRITAWRWESPAATQRIIRDTISAKYPIVVAGDANYEIKFHWDSEKGDVNPQAEILLQVLADAAEVLLRRGSRQRESRTDLAAEVIGSES